MSQWVESAKRSILEYAARRAAESAQRKYPDAKVTVDGTHIIIQHPNAVRDEFGDSDNAAKRWTKEVFGGR